MNEQGLSVNEIKELMETMSKHNMGRLKLRQGEYKLELESLQASTAPAVIAAPPQLGVIPPVAAPVSVLAEQSPPAFSGNMVTSPIVGTFYAAPAPEQPPYITPGQRVKKGDVLFIIESMKLMNEVTSEHDGVVGEILVENGQPVEYGQPILTIQ